MHGTPLLPPKGDHEVYLSEEDDQGHNLRQSQHPKINRNRASSQMTTGYDHRGKISPSESMKELREKKRSVGEAGNKTNKHCQYLM